jgi:hypothetical protein
MYRDYTDNKLLSIVPCLAVLPAGAPAGPARSSRTFIGFLGDSGNHDRQALVHSRSDIYGVRMLRVLARCHGSLLRGGRLPHTVRQTLVSRERVGGP